MVWTYETREFEKINRCHLNWKFRLYRDYHARENGLHKIGACDKPRVGNSFANIVGSYTCRNGENKWDYVFQTYTPETTRFELAVSASLRSVQSRGLPDLVNPLRPNVCIHSARGQWYRCYGINEKRKEYSLVWILFSFFVDATRFELATSASRTQRSTKLSHASISNIKIINKKRLIVK